MVTRKDIQKSYNGGGLFLLALGALMISAKVFGFERFAFAIYFAALAVFLFWKSKTPLGQLNRQKQKRILAAYKYPIWIWAVFAIICIAAFALSIRLGLTANGYSLAGGIGVMTLGFLTFIYTIFLMPKEEPEALADRNGRGLLQ